jgi:heat shock protein HtpX
MHAEKIRNTSVTIVLMGMIVFLSMLLGNMFFGTWGIFLVLAGGVFSFLLSPNVSSSWVLRSSRARQLRFLDSPELFNILDGLVQRARVPVRPSLHVLPSDVLNAFTLGSGSDPAIVLTDGLLRYLEHREIAGVLAHEVSHIKNGDLKMLALADSFRRFTRATSIFGILFLLFNLPFLLSGQFSFFSLILVFAAPTLSLLLELALSRTREFEADRMTIQLTGDPQGFISALKKLNFGNYRLWNLLVGRRPRSGAPGIFRTHPTIDERVKRMREESLRNHPDLI